MDRLWKEANGTERGRDFYLSEKVHIWQQEEYMEEGELSKNSMLNSKGWDPGRGTPLSFPLGFRLYKKIWISQPGIVANVQGIVKQML